MSKKSKHPRYDDPSAFSQQFPIIREVTDGSLASPLAAQGTPTRYWRMGKVLITVSESSETGYFMSIRHSERYPTWDEIVWVRYKLLPDAAVMSLVLPNLNNYINDESTGFKFVFTLEQKSWAIDPLPMCDTCKQAMELEEQSDAMCYFRCPECLNTLEVDCRVWNEQHGNGLKGTR